MPPTRSRVTGGVGLAAARHHFKVLISAEEVWRSTRRRSKLATNAENAFATRKHLNVSIISKETVQISVSRPLKWGLFKARAAASSYVRVLGNASLQPTLTGKDMKAASPSISVPVVHLHFNAPGTEDKIEDKWSPEGIRKESASSWWKAAIANTVQAPVSVSQPGPPC